MFVRLSKLSNISALLRACQERVFSKKGAPSSLVITLFEFTFSFLRLRKQVFCQSCEWYAFSKSNILYNVLFYDLIFTTAEVSY